MTDLLRSPLHDRHVALGAKLADFGGWEMPIEYGASGGGVLREHTAVREAVGVFDVSHLGKARVRGAAARDFVNSALTNDLDRMQPGKAQYTLCCDPATGGVVDDLIAYLFADDHVFLVPNAANTGEVVRRLAAAAPAGITVTDEHHDFGVLAVQGPRSAELLDRLGLPADHGYMSYTVSRWDGEEVVVCRTGYTGEHGYELLPVATARGRPVGRAAARPAPTSGCGRAGSAPGTRCAPRWATRCTGRTCRCRSPRCRRGPAGRWAGRSRPSGVGTRCSRRRRTARTGCCGDWRRSTAASRARTCRYSPAATSSVR